jgi:polysaccharide biosynthesis protein PslH
MKLLFLAPKIPWPATDGGRIAIYEPLRHLAARGHQVCFIGFGSQSEADSLCTRAGLYWARGIPQDTASHVLPAALSFFSASPYTASKYQSSAMRAALREAFHYDRFDVVQLENTHMAHYLGDIRHAGIPSVLRLHNVESLLAARYARTLPPPLRWLGLDQARRMRRFEATACHSADLCLAITPDDAERICQLAPDANLAVMPAGVDLQRFYPRPMSEEPGTIVFVGSLDWGPNIDAVRWFRAEAWPRIRQQVVGARWLVVGKYPPADILRWPEEDHSIQVTGFVEDVRPFLNKACVVVVPLRSGGGMRLKILEAMAAGKAVVSTPVGAEGIEVAPGEEMVIAPANPSFATEVIRLLQSPAERKRISKLAEVWVKPFGWPRLAEMQEVEYHRLLETPSE